MTGLCVSYCMVCVFVREDTPRALASGLSPVYMHSHTIMPYCTSMHVHFVYCELFDVNIEISLKGAISINKRKL